MKAALENVATIGPAEKIRWLCSDVAGLTKRQRDWCREKTEFLRPIILGAKLGYEECARKMAFERWNCAYNEAENFDRVFQQGASLLTAIVVFGTKGFAKEFD